MMRAVDRRELLRTSSRSENRRSRLQTSNSPAIVEHRNRFCISGYFFTLHQLQSKNEGYTPRELEFDGEERAWGQDGHATRYYAVLIKSKIARPKAPKTIFEQKAYMGS
jgi:hypothetical protein